MIGRFKAINSASWSLETPGIISCCNIASKHTHVIKAVTISLVSMLLLLLLLLLQKQGCRHPPASLGKHIQVYEHQTGLVMFQHYKQGNNKANSGMSDK